MCIWNWVDGVLVIILWKVNMLCDFVYVIWDEFIRGVGYVMDFIFYK